MRRALASIVLLLLGCSEPAATPSSHVLPNGTSLEVSADGAVAVSRGDRVLASIASGGPFARRFDTRITGVFGSYDFARRNEVALTADRYVGAREEGELVVLDFEGADGVTAQLTFDGSDAERTVVRLAVDPLDGAELDAIGLPFRCDDDATFLGFGAQYDGIEHRGESFDLLVEEQGIGRASEASRHQTYFPMPYWLDLRGFGVLIDTPARTLVDLCDTDPSRATVEVEDDAPLEVSIFHGPSPMEVIEQLGDVVGRPARPPAWAFSLWIGVQGGRDAVLAEEAALRDAAIPFSALWAQDWTGQREIGPGRFGVRYRWTTDEDRYPDLAGMIAELHARDVRFLGYANPFVVDDLEHYGPMDEAGLLLRDPEGASTYDFPIIELSGSMPDFTQRATYDYVEGFLTTMTRDLGMDGWMADFGEWLPFDATLADGREAPLVHNLYPTDWHRASREVMDRERPDGDWVIFTRSGWTHEHEVAQIVWIGDQEATYSATDGLPTVIPALLSLGLSGLPFVTHDVAGFSGGPSTKALWMRWAELGALTPIFRTHEGLLREENWDWNSDAETIAHTRRLSALHEALADDWSSAADEAARSSAPMLRPLSLVFPDDAESRGIADAFMIGSSLLAAPVIEEGATSRTVHLPPGTWFDVWTGTSMEGGRTVTLEAPLGSPPLLSLGVDRPDLRDAVAGL